MKFMNDYSVDFLATVKVKINSEVCKDYHEGTDGKCVHYKYENYGEIGESKTCTLHGLNVEFVPECPMTTYKYKTLQQFMDECTWCNAGYRCLCCYGCRKEFDEQEPTEVKHV